MVIGFCNWVMAISQVIDIAQVRPIIAYPHVSNIFAPPAWKSLPMSGVLYGLRVKSRIHQLAICFLRYLDELPKTGQKVEVKI
jgi:hypothetical protein